MDELDGIWMDWIIMYSNMKDVVQGRTSSTITPGAFFKEKS